jgi:naphthoate synthase
MVVAVTDYEDVDYTVEGPTAVITINRRSGTTRSAAVRSRADQARSGRPGADPAVQAVILTGAGTRRSAPAAT